jgi:hypothetical protein
MKFLHESEETVTVSNCQITQFCSVCDCSGAKDDKVCYFAQNVEFIII